MDSVSKAGPKLVDSCSKMGVPTLDMPNTKGPEPFGVLSACPHGSKQGALT